MNPHFYILENKFKHSFSMKYNVVTLINTKCYVPFLMNNIDFNLSDLLKR